MRNFFIFLILLIVGVKYGVDYLFSQDFQAYANKTKAPWTCQIENFVGQMFVVMSEYEKAKTHFTHAADRCPETPMAEEAEFGIARSLEGLGHGRNASQAYDAFAAKYPRSRRARTAIRAAEIMHAS